MIKALFFDLDGTLLKSDKSLDPSSVSAIKKCREKGIKVFIATARPYALDRMLGWDEDTMALFDGGVFCNGACCIVDHEIEYTMIDSKAVAYCIDLVKQYPHFHIALQMKDEIHAMSHPLDDSARPAWGLVGRPILPIAADCESITAKILIYDHNLVDVEEKIPESMIEQLRKTISDKANIYLTDAQRVVQITSIDASKLTGIEKVCRQLGLKKEEVAVFGDDVNDYEMLTGFPYSIAMGNANESIKACASWVTKTNDQHGIEFALRTILKLID